MGRLLACAERHGAQGTGTGSPLGFRTAAVWASAMWSKPAYGGLVTRGAASYFQCLRIKKFKVLWIKSKTGHDYQDGKRLTKADGSQARRGRGCDAKFSDFGPQTKQFSGDDVQTSVPCAGFSPGHVLPLFPSFT